MDLCPPFEGWTLDDDGIIHTTSGYRCTPEQIEAALWLTGVLRWDFAKRPIFADSMIEPRRSLSDSRDWIGEDTNRLQIVARRKTSPCIHCTGRKTQSSW